MQTCFNTIPFIEIKRVFCYVADELKKKPVKLTGFFDAGGGGGIRTPVRL